MPVRSNTTSEERTVEEPADHVMFEREGFDEAMMRRDLADVQSISLDDIYVERDEKEFADPRTLDLPIGPTGYGETGGTGVDTLVVEGERWPTHRFTHGFSTLREDNDDTTVQERATMEMFQYFGDIAFLKYGVAGQNNVFDYLRSAVPSERTIDASTYTSEYEGREEQVLTYDAVAALDGRLMGGEDNVEWDLMVGGHEALTLFNKKPSTTDTYSTEQTYWEKVSDIIGSRYRLPYNTSPTTLPRDLTDSEENELEADDLEERLVADPSSGAAVDPSGDVPLGHDELFILPDLDVVASDFWRLFEMGAPQVDGPISERGGRDWFDYIWRYTHKYDPTGRYPDVPGVIHLTNVSDLLD